MDQQDYRNEIGRQLRDIRHQQDLTLDEVETRSHRRFTAAAVASWERGDRNVTAPDLVELADFYSVPAVELFPDHHQMPAAAHRQQPDQAVIIDVHALHDTGRPDVDIIVRYVDHIRQRRNDPATTITLRHDDLTKLAAPLGITVEDCRQLLADAETSPPDGPHVIIDLDASASRTTRSERR